MSANYRDLVIDALADDEAINQLALVALEVDNLALRETLCAALARLHDTTKILNRTRASLRNLLEVSRGERARSRAAA